MIKVTLGDTSPVKVDRAKGKKHGTLAPCGSAYE